MHRLAALLAMLAAGCTDASQGLMAPMGPSRTITGISVHCIPSTLQLGGYGFCQATASDGSYLPLISWWSSNSSIVQVDLQGNTHAVGTGSALVYASAAGFTNFAQVGVPSPLPPLSISISGPTSITREGTYGWSANESNRVSGETVTYRWDASTDGGATWAQVSTSQYYTRSPTTGSPSFQLRLTSTSSAYRSPSSSTTSTSVSVANPLLPPQLSVTAAGPDYIGVAGSYQWTAYPTGGVAPYSYVWEKTTDGSTWTLLISSQYTYPIYTQTAQMSFGCNTSSYLRYRAKVTSSDGQVAYGYRNTNVYIPSC